MQVLIIAELLLFGFRMCLTILCKLDLRTPKNPIFEDKLALF